MGLASCIRCGTIWNVEKHPICPKCLSKKWESYPDIIIRKHNPKELPNTEPKYRSVVTIDVVTNLPVFLDALVTSGSCFFNTKHNKYCYYVPEPIGAVSGSAIPAGSSMPVSQLNSLVLQMPL